MEHLDDEQVARYVTSTATDLDIAPLERHIDGCSDCRLRVAALVRANRESSPKIEGDVGIGTTIGRYVVHATRGTGAMGAVLEATDPDLGRKVALKIVYELDAVVDARALREGRALARLAHPNVVTVHDVGIWSGGVFLAMELVKGATLREWMTARRGWRATVRVFLDVARGLGAAHAVGLVHRDIKPENIVVGDDGRVRVIDFGLAIDEASTGALGGTPAYMAPEQRRGIWDARSDQYAYMVTLYEVLHGKRPAADLVFDRSIPYWLRGVLRRGLAVEPGARFGDMAEVARTLERGLGRRRRHATIGGVLAVGAVAAGVAGVLAPTAERSCDDGAARLTGVWDDARKQVIHTALLAGKQTYAADTWRTVERALDQYASAWRGMHLAACRAARAGEQSQELFDLRMRCLDEQLARVRSLSDILATGGEDVVRNAATTTLSLDPLDRCADIRALRAVAPLPADPIARTRLEQARKLIDEAKALALYGRATRAEALLHMVPALDYPPLEAERLLVVGRLARTAADYDRAETALRDAVREADKGGVDDVRIAALVELVDLVGIRKGNPTQALEIAKDATALLGRTGNDPVDRARVQRARGEVLSAMGRHDDAVVELRAAADAIQRTLGPLHPLLAQTLNHLGNALVRSGHDVEARQTYERAIAIHKANLGEMHPTVVGVSSNLGPILLRAGDVAGAEALYRRAIEITVANLGPDHPDVAVFYGKLGHLLRQQGRLDDALNAYASAERIYARKYGRTFHPYYAIAIASLARAKLMVGRAGEALADIQRAMKLLEGHEHAMDPNDFALFELVLGFATWDTGGSHAQARAHVEAARQQWVKVKQSNWASDLADAESWLASHRS